VKSKRALITGGAGFIGSHLVDRLVKERWFVRIIDNLSTGKWENINHHMNNSNVEIVIKDLKETSEILKFTKDINVIFHFAANPEVRTSVIKPEIHFSENVIATFNLLEIMRKNDVEEIVFASSSSVYGEPEKIPVHENAPIRPISVYGASKASCENFIHAYSKLYGIRAVILRYANVVGPRQRHGVIYDFLLKLFSNSSELEVLGDGSQIRSYIYIDDAIEATLIAYMKKRKTFEVYNVGSDDWITVLEVAKIVSGTLGLSSVKLKFKPYHYGIGWPGDVKRIALSIDKIKSLGFKPRYSSREAIKLTTYALINELSTALK